MNELDSMMRRDTGKGFIPDEVKKKTMNSSSKPSGSKSSGGTPSFSRNLFISATAFARKGTSSTGRTKI